MEYNEITSKKLEDYGYDSRKLSIRKAKEIMLVIRHVIACETALMGSLRSDKDEQSDKIVNNEWLCILLQDHIDELRLTLKQTKQWQ